MNDDMSRTTSFYEVDETGQLSHDNYIHYKSDDFCHNQFTGS